MKSSGASYLKFCSFEQRDHKNRVIWFSGDFSLNRQRICYLRPQKLRDDVNLRISFKNQCVHPVSDAVPAQTNNEDKEIPTTDSDPPKAVHVRFKLQKQCAFGEQFLVVGNDPVLGLWEPSNGLPLNWSEDHVWIGEVGLPSGKTVHYKFVLKSKIGTITWQTGPDRVLEIWDTDRVITVFEDWDSPELQNIVEEDPSTNVNEETSFEKLELPVVDENLSPPVVVSNEGLSNVEETMVAPNIVDDDSEAPDLSSGDGTLSESSENQEENVRDDDDDDGDDDDDAVITNGSDMQQRSKNEPRLVSEAPVLVPGSVPITEDIGTTELIKAEEDTVEITSTTPYDEKIELKDENGPVSLSEYSVETDIEEKQNPGEQEQPEDDNTNTMKQQNMQWGRKTLEKFLANLGFQ